MANVGTAAAGKTLIGTGITSSPTFASIGTSSGLTANGVVIAEGTGAFTATSAGTSGQVLTSNGLGLDPTFQNAPAGGVALTGDSGTTSTSATLTLYAHQSSNNCGETVKFVNSGTISTLNVTDSNDNTMIGANSGHSGQSGSENVGIGSFSLGSIQNGAQNTSIGRTANFFLTTGSNNTCIGHSVCESLVTGSANICIGVGAGGAYSGSESNNIIIGNNGVAAESAVTRIGANGTQTSCFISGIASVSTSNSQMVTINTSTGQLGSTTLPVTFSWTDVTGATQTISAANGYITDRGGGVTYTLPASGSLGDTFIISGKSGITTITPNANQQLLIGSASGTVGATGTAVSTNTGDCITFVCTTSGASTVWRAISFVGNWTLS